MKPGIHPELKVIKAHCGCGHEFQTLSTADEIRVDICSNCHPFFTGEERMLDTEGRVQRFERRYGKAGKAKK
ncbi:MAG TPA: 50S ribosomal protein L31 [Candidatus Bipolaricaulota bacterium]